MSALRINPLIVALCLCLYVATQAVVLGAPNSLPDNVNALEIHFFSHSYNGQPLNSRLDRLDKFVFGNVRKGPAVERTAYLMKSVQSPRPVVAGGTSGAGTARTASKPIVASRPVPRTAPPIPHQPAPPIAAAPPRRHPIAAAASPAPPARKSPREVEAASSPNLPGIKTYSYGSHRTKLAYARKPDVSQAQKGITVWRPETTPRNSHSKLAHASPPPAPSSLAPSTHSSSLIRQVAMLEIRVFGHTNAGQPLMERVQHLELAVVPNMIISPGEPLQDRIFHNNATVFNLKFVLSPLQAG